MKNTDKFEQLKKELEEERSRYSEAKGKLDTLKQSAKEEFGTDDLDELKELLEKYKEKDNKLKEKKEELEEEIENLLEEIRD